MRGRLVNIKSLCKAKLTSNFQQESKYMYLAKLIFENYSIIANSSSIRQLNSFLTLIPLQGTEGVTSNFLLNGSVSETK